MPVTALRREYFELGFKLKVCEDDDGTDWIRSEATMTRTHMVKPESNFAALLLQRSRAAAASRGLSQTQRGSTGDSKLASRASMSGIKANTNGFARCIHTAASKGAAHRARGDGDGNLSSPNSRPSSD